jgi:hypothetical protein
LFAFYRSPFEALFVNRDGFSSAIDNAQIIPFALDYPNSIVVTSPDNINAVYWQ